MTNMWPFIWWTICYTCIYLSIPITSYFLLVTNCLFVRFHKRTHVYKVNEHSYWIFRSICCISYTAWSMEYGGEWLMHEFIEFNRLRTKWVRIFFVPQIDNHVIKYKFIIWLFWIETCTVDCACLLNNMILRCVSKSLELIGKTEKHVKLVLKLHTTYIIVEIREVIQWIVQSRE